MSNRLQELTDKIYQEGVAKGNEEADKIIEQAKQEASDIVKKAKQEAEEIVKKAEQSAKETSQNADAELRLSSKQAVNALKQEITNVLTTKIIDESVTKSLEDDDFIQSIIETMVKTWNKDEQGNIDLNVLVNEKQQDKIKKYFSSKAKALLDQGLEISAGKNIKAGFQVSPKDGGYKLSFTDDDFANFFKEYLRPKMIELLFEEKKQ